MYVKNCCYRGCKNDSRYNNKPYMEGIFFIPFPKPKSNLHKCERWISACARPEFLNLQRITKHRFVCSFHFIGGVGPTENNPDPIAYHEFCNDDTHETCKTNLEKSWRTNDDLSIIVDEPSLIVEEPSLIVDELSLIVDKPSLIVGERSLIVDKKPSLRMSSDEPGLIIEKPSLIMSVDEPSLIMSVDEPSLIMSVDEPSLIMSVDEPSLIMSVDEPKLKMSVDEPRLKMSVDEPRLKMSVDEPRLKMSVDEPRLKMSFDEPSLIMSVDEPSLIMTVDEPSLIMTVDEPILKMSFDEPSLKILTKDRTALPVTDTTDLLKKFLENQYFSDIKELKWIICRGDDSSLTIFKINSPHKLAIEVKVNIILEFEILVYGKALYKNHSLFRSCPKRISKFTDLLNLLENINSLALCNGTGLNSEETKYSGKMANVNIYTKTFFSLKCYGFIENGNRKSCKNCNLFRSSQLLKQKRAKVKDLKNNRRNFRTMTREDLVAALNAKTRQNRILKRKNLQLKKEINTLKQSLSEEPNFVFAQAVDEDSFSSKENFLHLLYQEQLKLLKTKSKRPKEWHKDIIKWCLYLRAKSPSAYETLREVFPLPARRTLGKYESEFSCQSGFMVESIKEMRAKIDLNVLSTD